MAQRVFPTRHGSVAVSMIALAATLVTPGTTQAQDIAPSGQSEAADGAQTGEIIVTGSRIARQSQENLSSPTQILSQEDIAESGLVGVDDLLLLDTANIGSTGGAQDLAGGGADDRATRSANLRGLGVQSTLVLLNGRRVAHTDNYVNLVALTPSIAVERVETVLDGASALYGSDAIAGVINVITNKRFDGVRLSGQYTDIANAPGYIVQGMVGGGTDRFHAVLSASYEYQDKLQGYERSRTNFDNTSGLAQPGNYVLRSRPQTAGGGDVIIDNGINGPINYSQLYDQQVAETGSNTVQFADPDCTDPTTGGIYAGADAFPLGSCRFSYQQRNPIKPRSRVTLVHADANYELGNDSDLYFEGRYYQQGTERFGVGSFPITTGSLVVPASNPFNPYGVDATFVGRLLGNTAPDRVERVDVDAMSLIGGAKGLLPFGNNWRYDVSAGYSREHFVLHSSDTDLIAAQNAFNGFGGPDCQIGPNGVPSANEVAGEGNCVYFSPFGQDQQTNDPRTSYNTLTPFQRGQTSEVRFAEAVVSGDLLELPGGTMGVAVGTQIREESEDIFLDSGLINGRFGFQGKSLPGKGSRTIKSVFGEVYLPLFESLDIQLAGRYEDYGQFSTVDPKIGINFRPVEWLAMRGSYSTAFRAPDLGQAVTNTVTSGVGQTVDPLDPTDQGTFRTIRTVSNPNLRPEQSRNFNLGFTVTPSRRTHLSVDYFDFKFTDRITLEAAQQVINADPNGPRITRDEFGRLLAVNIGYFNAGRTATNGFDVRAGYALEVGLNTFSIENNATFITTYEVQLGVGSPVIDALGGRNATNPGAPAPKFRDNLQLSWKNQRHSANVLMRHTSGVEDDQGTGRIDAWTVFDAQYALKLGDNGQYKIAIGALNLFDQKPPQAGFTGYLPSLHDVLGRQAYARLTVDF
ncbi:TonB-dependent receptor plug domain-containing protein [Altericroceibacterium endophyticum]|uniref:TonB-dependent receptor n=1 Tax=Altericroceibacterium endophyticum TaxID=1808508 RepID=A0A6I4T891_9SPHN|nr:TonB-dependent receptor [Altericroceibacterium endophyticum]MXO66331.1 TonB-dependent receptor [Altericroceibacterium endophyticum]